MDNLIEKHSVDVTLCFFAVMFCFEEAQALKSSLPSAPK
jgi:hypothetical protein